MILGRYIINKVLIYFTGSVVIFTSILVGTSILFSAINTAFEFGLGFVDLLVVILYQIPRLLTYSFGLSILVVSTMITGQMSRSGEIAALKAAGVGPARIIRPFVLAGIIVGGLFAGISETAVPYCERNLADFQQYLLTTKQPNIQPKVSYTDYDNNQVSRVIYAKSVTDARLASVILLDYEPDTGRLSSITNAAAGEWIAGQGWRFYDGVAYQFEPGILRRISYKIQSINLLQTDLKEPGSRPIHALSSQDLYQQLVKKNKAGRPTPQAWVEFHLKLALPVSCIVLAVLGALSGIQVIPRHVKNPLGRSVMILIGYYSLVSLGMSLAIAGTLLSSVAGWLPVSVMGLLACSLFYRQYYY